MDINKILKSDYLDLLFEGRNKQYGGYELRRKYPERIRNAAIAGLTVIFLISAGPIIASLLQPKEGPKKLAVLTPVTLTEPPPIDPQKPPPPPPPSEPPPPVKPTVKFTPPVIKKDEEVKEDEKPPKQEEMKDAAAGMKTEAGNVDGIDPGIVDNPGTGTGVVAAPPPPQVYQFVEQMPKPEYDMGEYLSKHLQYPANAREAGIGGRVAVQFVVNEDGSITDVKVTRGIGGGCDQEAMRVVSQMPKWKPGKQNGKAVKVMYTQPITFRLE